MNRHDVKHKENIIITLQKAREQLETAALYLKVQKPRPMEDIYAVDDAHYHVCIALKRLGVSVKGGESP